MPRDTQPGGGLLTFVVSGTYWNVYLKNQSVPCVQPRGSSTLSLELARNGVNLASLRGGGPTPLTLPVNPGITSLLGLRDSYIYMTFTQYPLHSNC